MLSGELVERFSQNPYYFCGMAISFGEGLYAWRVYRGFTQEQLSEEADIVVDTISRHEARPGSGKKKADNPPSPKTIRKLADALKIKPEQFYTLPTALPEQEKTIEDIFDDVWSLYGSGKYTKEELQREALKFLQEIIAEERKDSEQGN
jgi:transcriptional regulator with XRE-family HTH domain